VSSAPHNPSVLEATGCPSEEDIACFIDGRAAPELVHHLLTHLDGCHACRRLIAGALSSMESSRPGPITAGGPRTFAVGEVVNGRYRIERFLSRGGMGEVYEAWDGHLDETVALKTVTCTGLDNARLCNRMRAEVLLARKVTHPNVCRILEFGLEERISRDQVERIPFLTMEYLRGETLASYVSRCGKLPEREVVSLATQVIAGLSAIHAAGIIHRDLKPENVFLLEADTGQRRAIVMDFGLARPLDRQTSLSSSQDTSTPGTPAYMAPEQALGQPASSAWDIYAFGVILYRLVSGQLPFKGDTGVAQAMARIRQPAPPLSRIVPDVNPVLDAVVARCLEREPEKRYATVSDLQRALDRIEAPRARRIRPGAYLFGIAALATLAYAIRVAQVRNAAETNIPRSAPDLQRAVADSGFAPHSVGVEVTPVSEAVASATAAESASEGHRRPTLVRSTSPHGLPPAAPPRRAARVEASTGSALPPTDDDLAIPSFVGSPAPLRDNGTR